MATNGLRIGTFVGAPVVVDWTVALLAGYWLFSDFTTGGIAALPGSLAFVGALLVAVLAHEIGHAATAAAFKIRAAEIVLTFFGGHVQFLSPAQKRWQDMLVSAAGPAVNLAFWAVLAFAVAPNAPPETPATHYLYEFLSQLAWVSLLLGAFNLLPGFPLDGGAILRAFLSYFMRTARARWVAAWIGVIIATAAAIWGVTNHQMWTAGVGLLLALSAFAEVGITQRLLRGA